ncbi:MAG: HAD family phosphatase [Actinobacteria bacterium]|nr:HAD family phosphatase [Actinomycetota bacterium]
MSEPITLDGSRIDVILFDLGGVVFQFDWSRAIASWSRRSGVDESTLGSRLRFDEDTCRFERGELGEDEYFSLLRARLDVELSTDELIEGWNAIFGELCSGITDVLAATTASHHRVAALSNTNATHARAWSARYRPALAPLGRIFTSHELGHRKPEPACYRAVIDTLGVTADRVVLFDDVHQNVAGARAFGMHAVQVTGTHDLRLALTELGVDIPEQNGPPPKFAGFVVDQMLE